MSIFFEISQDLVPHLRGVWISGFFLSFLWIGPGGTRDACLLVVLQDYPSPRLRAWPTGNATTW